MTEKYIYGFVSKDEKTFAVLTPDGYDGWKAIELPFCLVKIEEEARDFFEKEIKRKSPHLKLKKVTIQYEDV